MRAVYAAEKCCGAKGCHLWGHMRGEEAAQQRANVETGAVCMLNAISIASVRPSWAFTAAQACAAALKTRFD